MYYDGEAQAQLIAIACSELPKGQARWALHLLCDELKKRKLEFVHTPKHGSWLNRAECEFSVLSRQCLNRRIPDINTVGEEVAAWTAHRNDHREPVQWRFTTEDARIKLRSLYPQLSVWNTTSDSI